MPDGYYGIGKSRSRYPQMFKAQGREDFPGFLTEALMLRRRYAIRMHTHASGFLGHLRAGICAARTVLDGPVAKRPQGESGIRLYPDEIRRMAISEKPACDRSCR